MKYVVVAFVALALGLAGAWKVQDWRYGAVIQTHMQALSQQKLDASAELASETERTRGAEQALQDFKNTQEIKDAKSQTVVADLAGRLLALAGPAGRLRDPNQTGCGGGGGGATGSYPANADAGADDGAEAGGLFSAGATQLLQRLTRESDDINVAYASCRADALSLRKLLP